MKNKKIALLQILSVGVFSLVIYGCSPVASQNTVLGSIQTASTSNALYHCSYFGSNYFDTLTACQTETLANCDSANQTLPSGGTLNCYTPVAGGSACLTAAPPSYLYTTWSGWCSTSGSDNGNTIYQETRSLLGCSSLVCACLGSIITTQTCVNASGQTTPDCATVDPTFEPNASPTPQACPE